MKALIADDDPISRLLLGRLLRKWGFEVTVACDGLEALATFRQPDSPRIAILDWMMPGLDGLEVCREIRKSATDRYPYVVVLTARGAKEDLLAGLDAGADDFLTKPCDPRELQCRLAVGKRIAELYDRMAAIQEELQFKATHDPLTEILNRAAVFGALERELGRSAREEKPVAVLLADLDHFKQVNDLHGHAAGDRVLREAAARLTGGLRAYDTLGRYGGEEFLIVLPGCDGAAAWLLGERLRQVISARRFDTGRGAIAVTASLGIASTAECRGGLERLVAAADEALYVAKRAGRDRITVYGTEAIIEGVPA